MTPTKFISFQIFTEEGHDFLPNENHSQQQQLEIWPAKLKSAHRVWHCPGEKTMDYSINNNKKRRKARFPPSLPPSLPCPSLPFILSFLSFWTNFVFLSKSAFMSSYDLQVLLRKGSVYHHSYNQEMLLMQHYLVGGEEIGSTMSNHVWYLVW